jgi:hypothetical protein
MTVLSELSKYKLDSVGVQEVRWEGGGNKPAGKYTFFYGKGNENNEFGMAVFVNKRTISTVKRAEFVSDRMLYIILGGHWCHIIVSNIPTSTEDKTDDVKDSIYEEMECVFDKFPT